MKYNGTYIYESGMGDLLVTVPEQASVVGHVKISTTHITHTESANIRSLLTILPVISFI